MLHALLCIWYHLILSNANPEYLSANSSHNYELDFDEQLSHGRINENRSEILIPDILLKLYEINEGKLQPLNSSITIVGHNENISDRVKVGWDTGYINVAHTFYPTLVKSLHAQSNSSSSATSEDDIDIPIELSFDMSPYTSNEEIIHYIELNFYLKLPTNFSNTVLNISVFKYKNDGPKSTFNSTQTTNQTKHKEFIRNLYVINETQVNSQANNSDNLELKDPKTENNSSLAYITSKNFTIINDRNSEQFLNVLLDISDAFDINTFNKYSIINLLITSNYGINEGIIKESLDSSKQLFLCPKISKKSIYSIVYSSSLPTDLQDEDVEYDDNDEAEALLSSGNWIKKYNYNNTFDSLIP